MCTAVGGYSIFTPDSIGWRAGPPTLPPGVKVAVLEGNPSEPGPFTMRLWFPAGTRVEPHLHSGVEHATVVSGSVYFALGEVFAQDKLRRLPAGGFFLVHPGVPHFGLVDEDTVIQAHGVGPWQTTYIKN
jgi:quercetin dioxygenase-like cupin family protein